MLGQIFGSPDVSRTVAQNAASQTGLDPSLLKKMLPLLAMMVTGYMARQQGSAAPAAPTGSPMDSDLGGLLGGLFGGRQAAPGGGGLASMLDLNGDGNSLDDILRLAGKALR